MKNLLTFFKPIIWVIMVLYSTAWLFDLMNTNSTLNLTLGGIGILLIIYLTIITRLGTYINLFKFKNKKQ